MADEKVSGPEVIAALGSSDTAVRARAIAFAKDGAVDRYDGETLTRAIELLGSPDLETASTAANLVWIAVADGYGVPSIESWVTALRTRPLEGLVMAANEYMEKGPLPAELAGVLPFRTEDGDDHGEWWCAEAASRHAILADDAALADRVFANTSTRFCQGLGSGVLRRKYKANATLLAMLKHVTKTGTGHQRKSAKAELAKLREKSAKVKPAKKAAVKKPAAKKPAAKKPAAKKPVNKSAKKKR